MRWQQVVRAALAVFVVVFVIVIARAIRQREVPATSAPISRTDPKALTESTGASALQMKGAAQDYALSYQRRRTYEGGLTRFDGDVKVDVRGRAGRDFVLQGQHAEVGDDESRVEMSGDVVLTANTGLTGRTESATYTSADSMIRAPGFLTFESGRVSGEGVGGSYDQSRDVVWLLDQARIRIVPEDGDSTEIESGAAGFDRRSRYLRFERDVTITRGGQVTRADDAVVYLNQTDDRIELVELRGHSSIGYAAATSGGLEAMSANDMNLGYRDDGRTLERATLVGSARVDTKAADARSARVLAAQFIDMTLAPDGNTMTALSARDDVQLDLSEPDQPRRRVRSRLMDGTGTETTGITVARFNEHVEFHESRAAARNVAALDRTVRSQALELSVANGFGALQHARFTGQVSIKESALDAASSEATYDVAAGRVSLISAGSGGQRAWVNDSQARVEAAHVDVALSDHSLAAKTDVRSELRPTRGSDGPKRPGLVDDSGPVNVTGDSLDYDRSGQQATYTGNARLWQRETAVQGDVLTIDDATGNLTAAGNVRSVLPLEQANRTTGAPERSNTIATSKDMVYEEARHVATYTTNARMLGPQGDLRAEKIELHLAASGKSLERAEAFGNVLLRSNARWATGGHLTYFTADERYVMVGTPVRILEQVGPDCRETLGKTLTFFRSIDTIHVDGNQESRTQTKSGGKCPEPPTD